MSCRSSPQVGELRQQNNAAPSLHPHYKSFSTTTDSSAPRSGIGVLSRGVCHLSFPFASETRFSRSIPKPVLSSCRLYTDCRWGRKQISPQLVPELSGHSGFDSASGLTMHHRTVHFRSSSQNVPDVLTAPFPQSLTTAPFERSHTGWFETCFCKPIPGGRLPSLIQHAGLRLLRDTPRLDPGSSLQPPAHIRWQAAARIAGGGSTARYRRRGRTDHRPVGIARSRVWRRGGGYGAHLDASRSNLAAPAESGE